MTDLERELAEINGIDPSELEPKGNPQERIKELESALEALLNGETE